MEEEEDHSDVTISPNWATATFRAGGLSQINYNRKFGTFSVVYKLYIYKVDRFVIVYESNIHE